MKSRYVKSAKPKPGRRKSPDDPFELYYIYLPKSYRVWLNDAGFIWQTKVEEIIAWLITRENLNNLSRPRLLQRQECGGIRVDNEDRERVLMLVKMCVYGIKEEHLMILKGDFGLNDFQLSVAVHDLFDLGLIAIENDLIKAVRKSKVKPPRMSRFKTIQGVKI